MKLSETVEPLGLRLKRESVDVQVEIGIEGQDNTVESVSAAESRNKRGERILRLNFAPEALPVLVPRPLSEEGWFMHWVNKLLG